MVIVDKGFIKEKTEYDWWPNDEDSLFSGGGGGGSLNLTGSSSGKDALVALAVIVAVVIVVEATDVTVHNIRGMNVTVEVQGDKIKESFPLDWGVNRFQVSETSLQGLENGTARLYVRSTGTRKLKIELPTDGLRIKRDVHVIEFAETGNVIVDGNRIKLGLTNR